MNEQVEITLDVNPKVQQYFYQDKSSDIDIRALEQHSKTPSDKIYKLQKGYLYLESDYFSEVFKNSPQIKEIQLNIEDSPVLEIILKCFYGFKCQIEKKDIIEAFNICQYLKIESLQEQIINYIYQYVSELDIVKVWILSQKHNLRNLEEACVKRLTTEKYALFLNQEAYQSYSNGSSNQLKSQSSFQPNSTVSNIVQMNTAQFKKILQNQGSDFPFLTRMKVFNSIKMFCEQKFSTNSDVINEKICKITYDLIDPHQCQAEEYRDIFCQQIFHDYNNQKKSVGSIHSANNDSYQQQYLLQQSTLINSHSYSSTPMNFQGYYNQMPNFHHRFSGSHMQNPHMFTNGNFLMGGSQSNSNSLKFNGNSSKCSESLIFAQSIFGGKSFPQPIDELSEKLSSTFNDLTTSYQNFVNKSSQSDLRQSKIEQCGSQIKSLEEKMKSLLDEKKLRVSHLDEEIKKVDDYIFEQKKKNNMVTVMNSNVFDDMNNMLISTNQTQQQHQSDEMNGVERSIQNKNTFQYLMSSGSKSQDTPPKLCTSDSIPQKEDFTLQDNQFDNEKENIKNGNQSDDNEEESDFADLDDDELMEDVEEFSACKNGLPSNKQIVLNTPHINLEEITSSVQLMNFIQPEPIESSNSFGLIQSNNQSQMYVYEYESGSHDYRKQKQFKFSN